MTMIEMDSEFEYFTIERSEIVAALEKDGFAHDVTERVSRAVQRLAETVAGNTAHLPDTFIPSHAWTEAIRGYIKGHMPNGDLFGTMIRSGTLQFDSFAEEDYGQYWIIDLHNKNAYRGTQFEFRYLVMFSEGPWTGNINLACTVDDLDTADEIVRPTDAHVACPNIDCGGYFSVEAGVWLVTEQSTRFDPEAHEFDRDGMFCPFCTVWSVEDREPSAVPPEIMADGDPMPEPSRLRAVLHIAE